MNKLLLLVFTSLLTLLVIACTASSNTAQATNPKAGVYLGEVGFAIAYKITTDKAECVYVERPYGNYGAISCVRL